MGKPVLVEDIDDLMPIKQVFASVTDKSGLVSNKVLDTEGNETGEILEGLPGCGLVGVLFDVNSDTRIISTGGTAALIAGAGYDVVPIEKMTGIPEMKTGLVKSMDFKLYMSMLAHPYTPSDAEDMAHLGISGTDMSLVNFYRFRLAVEGSPLGVNPQSIEIARQATDVGGPTATHLSGKGFLATAVATRPSDYVLFANDLREHGKVGIEARLTAMQHATEDLFNYFREINDFRQGITMEHIRTAYPRIHNRKPTGGGE